MCIFLGVPLLFSLLTAGCDGPAPPPANPAPEAPEASPRAFFTEVPARERSTPKVERLDVPDDLGGQAIWGATGRDGAGHIWFGLSMPAGPGASARLIELDPDTDTLSDRGDVVSALKDAGRYQEGLSQNKIHSRIVEAPDGRLYFASMDESGADFETGRTPPTWGGHLWRFGRDTGRWEHLFAAPEGLIAVAVGRGCVYALGFFGHKLYQYRLADGAVRSVEVGSVGGHTTRNFMADADDHAYVPRLRRGEDGSVTAELIDYDADLAPVAVTPLEHYGAAPLPRGHGIIAFQPLADGSIVFATHVGYLYHIVPRGDLPAAVRGLGWAHPGKEPRYTPGLFTYAGKHYLLALTTQGPDTGGGKTYEWTVYHIGTRGGIPARLRIDGLDLAHCLLYGSVTRDNRGNFYLAGSDWAGQEPLILRVLCPE
jgi:hypothetical protein